MRGTLQPAASPLSPHLSRHLFQKAPMSSEAPIVNVGSRPVIVPVVLPPSADRSASGRIRNLAIRVIDHSGWLQEDGENGWALKKNMERKGYILLEDLYAAEQNPEGWAQYKRYLSDWQGGRTTRSFPAHLLPKEVLDRQAGLIEDKFRDPWNLPAVAPTTGQTTEAKSTAKAKAQ